MSTWPIRWGFGGISWRNGEMGLSPSLFVALRFGSIDGSRKALGFIVRRLPKHYRAQRGFQVGRFMVESYRQKPGSYRRTLI